MRVVAPVEVPTFPTAALAVTSTVSRFLRRSDLRALASIRTWKLVVPLELDTTVPDRRAVRRGGP